jgi:hypothetical protein
MKRILTLLATLTLLSGCAETLALLAPATSGAGSGKIAQSAVSSVLSYGVKQQTGKSPSEHALIYVKKNNPERKKDACISFIKKTNSEVCAMIKKKISLTRAKIINTESYKNLKDSSLLIQSKIDKKSQIQNLD